MSKALLLEDRLLQIGREYERFMRRGIRDWGGGSGMSTHSSSKRTARGVSRIAEVDIVV